MHGIEQQIVVFLQSLFNTVGWAGVVAAMAIESACIPLPSEVTMPLAGWMLIQAKGFAIGSVLWAGLYGALGCTIGSVITYWIGAKGGRPILERYGKYVLISTHDIEVADRWFNKYGEGHGFLLAPAADRADFHFFAGRRRAHEFRPLHGPDPS